MTVSMTRTIIACCVFAIAVGGGLPTAKAKIAFHDVVSETPWDPMVTYHHFYMLCDDGTAYMIVGRNPPVSKDLARRIMGRDFCRGRGGWLGEGSHSELRIEPLPTRSDRWSGARRLAALRTRCDEDRSEFATYHTNPPTTIWRCGYQVQSRALGRFR